MGKQSEVIIAGRVSSLAQPTRAHETEGLLFMCEVSRD